MSDPQIIRDPDVLDSIDPNTVVIDSRGDVRLVRYAWRVPAIVICDGAEVRAARKALNKETE